MRYSLIHDDESSGMVKQKKCSHRLLYIALWTQCIIIVGLAFVILLGGSNPKQHSAIPGWFTQRFKQLHLIKISIVALVSTIFRYNRDFSYPPSNNTNAAWDSLFPKNGGFFSHPPEVQERSTLAVFHQLHCLVS